MLREELHPRHTEHQKLSANLATEFSEESLVWRRGAGQALHPTPQLNEPDPLNSSPTRDLAAKRVVGGGGGDKSRP